MQVTFCANLRKIEKNQFENVKINKINKIVPKYLNNSELAGNYENMYKIRNLRLAIFYNSCFINFSVKSTPIMLHAKN